MLERDLIQLFKINGLDYKEFTTKQRIDWKRVIYKIIGFGYVKRKTRKKLQKVNINIFKELFNKATRNYGKELFKAINEKLPDEVENTPLTYAVSERDYIATEILLKIPGIDVNGKQFNGWTALIIAAAGGELELVKMLVNSSNIDVNIQENEGYTALMWASVNGKTDIVKVLLQLPNININIKDKYGETALTLARKEGHHKIIKMLKIAGAKE